MKRTYPNPAWASTTDSRWASCDWLPSGTAPSCDPELHPSGRPESARAAASKKRTKRVLHLIHRSRVSVCVKLHVLIKLLSDTALIPVSGGRDEYMNSDFRLPRFEPRCTCEHIFSYIFNLLSNITTLFICDCVTIKHRQNKFVSIYRKFISAFWSKKSTAL